ncbi:MAG: lipoprotein [Gammaproteobacteria bacterium]|nr:lipoprotein [Gammaproteobacteria bacterium]
MLVITLFCMFALSACGQKGPLYMPDDKVASINTPHFPG